MKEIAAAASAVWAARKRIAYIVGVCTLVAIVISLILPNYYRSTAIILPDADKGKLGQLGGIADLAALAGINATEGSMVKLYPTIIKSEAVLRNVLYARYASETSKDSVDLIQFWEIEGKTPDLVYEFALKTLREELDVSMETKTNVVSISISTKQAELSAHIVNNVTAELDRFIRTKRTTNASEQRKWIEDRLKEVKSDLEKSENTLKEFREKNRRVSDSPQLLLEQERLIREVQINTTLYTELKKQYELVKIEEIKNIPIISVMDAGRPAARKEKPKRTIIVGAVFFLSFLSALGYVFVMGKYEREIKEFTSGAYEVFKGSRRKE